ncbi:T9SS type B sorting domain-containing protein [Empedobacter falsenii]
MKYLYSITFFLIFTIFSFSNTLGFEKNVGQIVNQNNKQNTSILYTLKLDGFNINLNKEGFNYDFYEDENNILRTHRIEFKFKNYNPNFKIIQSNQIDYFENYIHQNKDFVINFYQKIIYKNFYQNIDLEFYVNNNSQKPFEYNFVLHPGSNINDIQFDIKGAKEKLKANQLDIKLRFGDLVESLPKSWIEYNNKSENISVEYCYHQNGNIGLQTNQNITNKKVVIDPLPIRKWGSYLSKYYFNGYPTDNHFMSIDRVKFHGNEFYIFGTTSQRNLATTGAFQTIALNNTYQPFIAKFNTKSERVWFTYFGSGGNTEYAGDMDIDKDGNIYVGFNAFANGLATLGAYQVKKDDYSDILIAKFNTNGVRQWATYYGGNLNEEINALKVDPIDNTLYIAGSSSSSNLVHSSNAIIKTQEFNEGRGLIVKFDLNGNYIWSSLSYGGVDGLTIDNEHNIIITENRSTSSSNYLAYNKELSKYDKNLTPIWIQKNFGQIYTPIEKIITDNNNDIIIVGATFDRSSVSYGNSYSPTFTSSSIYVNTPLAGFLKKFSSNGTQIFGTFIGEKGKSYVSDIVIGHNNEIIIVGDAIDESKVSYGGDHFQTNIENRSLDKTNDNALLMKFDSAGNPIWGLLSGDKAYFNRYVGVDFNKNTNEIIAVGWNVSPYMISTPNGYQTKPIYEHEYGRLTGYNGTLTLYEDKPNNFKIDKSGDDCYIDSLTYTASGANNYTWYDYDGNIVSTSSIFSPSISGQYTCKFDDGKNIGYISIVAQEVNLNLPPTPIVNNLPKITNYCIVKLDKPKAITSCGDEIEGTTEKTEFNETGIYQVLWKYTDKFGNNSEQMQKVEVLAVENFLNTEPIIQVCENDSHEVYDLTSIENSFNIIEKVKFEYFENITDLTNNLPITNPKSYINSQGLNYVYIKGILANGCSNYTKIHLKIKPKPIANNLEKILCDASSLGYVNVILNKFNLEINPNSSSIITYYSDENFINQVEKLDIIDNQKIYVVVEENGCINKSIILFKLSNYTLISSTPFEICKDNSSIGAFDLDSKSSEIASLLSVNKNDVLFFESLENAQKNQNPIIRNYENKHNLTKLYATSISTNACKTFVEIPLIENINPIIHIDTTYYKCKNSSIDIDLEENYDHINWSTGEINKRSINISKPGEYSVTVTNRNCKITKKFVVNDYNDLNIEYKYDGKQVHFTILNDLNAKMSLDGINYTSNFSFTLEQGEHTFYFKSSNDCIEVRKIYLYKDLPSIMTPNGDGKNDIWDLSYIKDLLSVKVFNRYGRTVFEATKDNQPIKWDGKYQLRHLPTDTYWYIIDLENGEKIQGSILIKNK